MKNLLVSFMMVLSVVAVNAQITPASQMEKLDRGLVALPVNSGSGNFVSWRFLGTDDNKTSFDLLRNGTTIANDLTVTNYTDAGGNSSSTYQVKAKVDGEVVSTSESVKTWEMPYKQLKLDRPTGGTYPWRDQYKENGKTLYTDFYDKEYTYSPNDCSVGDVDGDGQYELIVKWAPSNAQDNSQTFGKTGNVYLDCYKFDGTKLWRIDLGMNIRAGAHYTQFQVFDFDGDGKAEMICKTAPGSMDGKGNYVSQAATDEKILKVDNSKEWRNQYGVVDGGHEYLTVFNGETGAAIHTIAYYPNRNAKAELSEATGTFNWDDRSGKTDKGNYGNRGERFLAATAYLDGPDKNPSGIFCRGYYTYAYVWAVDFDGKELKTKWLHSSDTKTTYKVMDADGTTKQYTGTICTSGLGRYTMYANGNHNMSIADVDGDGKDEVVWGSAALDDDGKMLYSVGFGHGDAIHLADHCPDRPGLELFDVHEEKGTYAWDLHDAATGEIILKGGPEGVDNGRGMAGNFYDNERGSLFWSAADGQQRSAATGEVVANGGVTTNFRIYWDGDLQEELLDGTKIDKWTMNGKNRLYIKGKNPYDYNSSSSCNGSKATPNLQADLFGDWREEIILWSTADNATLNIFSTNIPTEYRVPTLMHDHTYRMGVAWQNTAYNQPPHLGYYLPDYISGKITGIIEIREDKNQALQDGSWYTLSGQKLNGEPVKKGLYIKNGRKIIIK